ncbi:AAA family ATPase [Nesterenkonia alba]|uniref:AAA family ATPase n=1 Tax=Nesterenkonia alba TaxID=515814 RepID=UPI0003B6595B|nr:AAA family ATPase [Nesterenkonia alba]
MSVPTAVLCCTENDRTEELRQALSDAGVEVTRHYASSQALLSGLSQGADTDTDVLVVDESSAPMAMWDLAAEVAGRYPSIAVLTVVNQPTGQDYATALDRGVRGVITYPLTFEDVAARVQSATSWGSSLRNAVQRTLDDESSVVSGKMVAVASAKGGAGSSTAALHVALHTAQHTGRRVVLVDLDLQKPDQSILLDAPRQRDITDLLPVVEELSPRFISDVLFEHPNGLSVLFGPAEGERGELISEAAAQKILGMLRTRFDVVIVDVGSVMGEANTAAVEMADDVCILTHTDVLALRGVRRLTALWERLGVRRPDDVKVVFNAVDKRADIQPAAAKKIVGLSVLDTMLPKTQRSLEQAVNRREPEVAGEQWFQRIEQLAAELGLLPAAEEKPSRRGKRRRGGKHRPPSEPRQSGAKQPTPEQDPAKTDAAGSVEKTTQGAASSNGRRRRLAGVGGDRGQSTLEFAGMFALWLVTAMVALQLIIVGTTWVFASHAASEAARAASVDASVEEAAANSTPGAWRDEMTVEHHGDRVRVELRAPVLVPASDSFAFRIPASSGVTEEP